MAGVAVVTDSTAALPADVVTAFDISVVPLQVVLGGRVGADGIDVSPADVALALAARLPVSTSRPTPAAFARVYADAAAAGYAAAVSIHLSSGLSSTYDAALAAAADAPLPVQVVDSRSTAMGLGFPVLAAAAAAAGGNSAAEVVTAALRAVGRTRAYFSVQNLEALRRGGRIGHAAAIVGSALSVKPLLHVVDGRIALLEKVRTSGRALLRLEELATVASLGRSVDVAVHHLAARERAEQLAGRLHDALDGLVNSYVTEVGAVLGAHVGAGLLGVVVHSR